MTNPRRLAAIALATLLSLSACGSDGDESTESQASDEPAATTAETVDEVTPEEPVAETTETTTTTAAAEPAPAESCAGFMTPADFETILGVAVEISGSQNTCNVIFADDAVGTFQAWTGSRAEDSMEVFNAFKSDESAIASGILLDDDRGFISEGRIYVIGDSGTVMSLSTPSNAGVDDLQTKLQGFADIFLTK